ncbi:MAG: ATP-dependent DNA helicase RecG [Lachnospiraceae bacterium]|nr:ATP-dependent DNA helicase RecG [Lachnospiraceae bacterium]MBD5455899.1 ATP-dependent DNA helicase RecG [Lachnospiraceae bacterium]
MDYSDNIINLKGVGDKTSRLFNRLGIYTVHDLLDHFPRDYEAFAPSVKVAKAPLDIPVTLELTVCAGFQWKKVRQLSIGTGMAGDDTGKITITFFNAPYLKNVIKAGGVYLMRGKLKKEQGVLHMDQPKLYTYEEYSKLTGSLQPCYRLTAGLSNKAVQKAMKQALPAVSGEEYLPSDIIEEYQLISRKKAYQDIHFPKNYDEMLLARKRLAFDEFFLFLISLRKLKEMNEEAISSYPMIETALTKRLIESLPYRLTGAQLKVWDEIKADLTSGRAMNRLIQGDVGSGKTVLAFLSLLMAVANGYQGALMAPTEILARQHYEQLLAMNSQYGLSLKPVLLTGSVTAAGKRKIYEKIESGEADIVIGTHALIQEKVTYHKLALVITDEQHRFGVKQRENLSEKGDHAHVLVMSATPIPRTLAIILYGDLHLSVIDELPANRLPIKNCVVNTTYRKKAYEFITKEVENGHQVYVICPMVDENEEMGDVENVTEYTQKLKSSLPSKIHVEYLHGKMKAPEKNRIMEEFAAGNIDVLVSTTVIEVGINVPNATVMMIENAERFGLAQLHQLRGRIGRGKSQSYCIFMSGSDNSRSMDRLKILNQSNDGFFIAEEDLKLRGPGDLFGIRQSGAMEFKIADIYQDSGLLKKISISVDNILQQDKDLSSDKYNSIQRYLIQNTVNFVDFRTI